MRESLVLPINEKLQRSQANILKRIRKRFFRKKVVISLLSILAAVILLIGAYSYMTLHQTVIPYDGETVSVRELNGELYASCTSDIAAGSVACIPSPVMIDGERRMLLPFIFIRRCGLLMSSRTYRSGKMRQSSHLPSAGSMDRESKSTWCSMATTIIRS